jgi:gallate decarboxylase subunit C
MEPVRSHLRDLRSTIDWLRDQGDLLETDEPVNPDLEVIGLQKHLDGACPMLFNHVVGKPNHRLIVNLFGDLQVVNKMFGWADDTERTRRIANALANPIRPVTISSEQAPIHTEVIESPVDISDYLVPIRHTELEHESTIGTGVRVLVGDAFGGGTDIGYNRMNFRWGNVGTFQIAPGSHLWQVLMAPENRGKHIPITVCFGIAAAATVMSGAAFDYVILPHGCDELGVAGALQNEPIRLVKARTVDAFALADAEISLEGYLDAADRRFETEQSEQSGVQGKHPFHPEWAGYMGKAYKAPTFHVTAVTSRGLASRPPLHALASHTADSHNVTLAVREACIFELCQRMQPGIVQDVHIPYSMTDYGGAIIQVAKRNALDEGWQRNFLAATLSTSQGMRIAIAVSPDVDIYDMDEIMWCLATRVNPHSDFLNPLPGGRGQTFMPAERMTAAGKEWTAKNAKFEGGLGIDATVPFGYEADFERPRYPIDKVDPERFFSAEALSHARSRISGWAKTLSRTGR